MNQKKLSIRYVIIRAKTNKRGVCTISCTLSTSKEIFNALAKHAISTTTNAEGTIIANMGNGNYITYRTVSSSGFPATIDLNFQNL